MLHYALFNAHPASQPPFIITLGFDKEVFMLQDCQHIPDGIQKMEQYCQDKAVQLSPNFTLLYPIYMDAMGTDAEMSMHNIAWLIKDEADAKAWKFDRIGGLTNRTENDFVNL